MAELGKMSTKRDVERREICGVKGDNISMMFSIVSVWLFIGGYP